MHILSSVFDFLCAANFNFVRGGLAKFARACAQLRGNIGYNVRLIIINNNNNNPCFG